MLHNYFKSLLLSTILLHVSLNAKDSLEDSQEFQRLLMEARKSNQAKDEARALARQKEAEAVRREALLKMENEVGDTKFFNSSGEKVEKIKFDYIEIPVPHVNKGHLEFVILYHNRNIGGPVSWENGSAILDCKAYAKNGKLLGSIKNKKIGNSHQQHYVKFNASAGTLKCNLDFLGKLYHDDITFGGFSDLYSNTYSESYK